MRIALATLLLAVGCSPNSATAPPRKPQGPSSLMREAEQKYAERLAARLGYPHLAPGGSANFKRGDFGLLHEDGRSGQVGVFQVIDSTNALILGGDIWVEGVDTSDVVDGGILDLTEQPFVVAGTKQYTTAIGTRTVRHLIALDKGRIAELIARELAGK
jgi:hypothetical protein